MEYANPPYLQPQRPFYPIDISNFKQYRDEPIYDAWIRFRNLLRKFPHHSFSLASLTRTFYYRVGQYDQMRIEDFANGDFRELSAEEAWDAIEDCAQYYYRVDNPTNVSTSQLNINFQDHETSLFGDEYISVEIPKWLSCNAIVQNKHIGNLDKMEDEVNNISSPSTPQILPSFEAHTPPVTYPEEIKETIGIPIEVEPLNQTQLEDIGLNTYNDNLTLSSREVPSFDEPEPQPKPLPNLPSLDENLGIEIGSDPPIKPYSLGSLRTKVVDSKPCREEADIGVEHDLTYLHHSFVIDHKKHYGFKPGLLGQDGSPTRNLSKLIENDPFLGENLNPHINPIELGKVMMIGAHPFERIIHPPLFPHVAYFHPKGVYRYFHPHLILSVGKTSPISVK
jgi:hypothetical protein